MAQVQVQVQAMVQVQAKAMGTAVAEEETVEVAREVAEEELARVEVVVAVAREVVAAELARVEAVGCSGYGRAAWGRATSFTCLMFPTAWCRASRGRGANCKMN